MTYQEMFNKSYFGVIRQGGPSIESSGNCVYRSPTGRKCGIGHLITDERYTPCIEGDKVENLHLESLGLPDSATARSFLVQLQDAHDEASDHAGFLSQFEANMRAVASKYHLTIPEE